MVAQALTRNVLLSEWDTELLKGHVLSPQGSLLAESLNAGGEYGARLIIDELRSGLRIRSQSWIGLVHLDEIQIQVRPKLDGINEHLLRIIGFAWGLDSLRKVTGERPLKTSENSTLLDLLALLFVQECENLVRKGLLADYVEREDQLPVLRGRLLADRQVLKRFGQIDKLECRFDEYEQNIIENRLLGAALGFCRGRIQDPWVRKRAKRLHTIFREACDCTIESLDAIRRSLGYHRLNAHYEKAHALAWLLFDAFGVDDLYARGATNCFAFLINMNQVFEKFLGRYLTGALRPLNLDVTEQAQSRSVIREIGSRRSWAIRPDYLVQSRDMSTSALPIDAKYKLYDENKMQQSDVYQTFLYAYAYGEGDGPSVPKALVLHPATAEGMEGRIIRVQSLHGSTGAEIQSLGVPLNAAIEEAEAGFKGPVTEAIRARILSMLDLKSEDKNLSVLAG